MYGVLIGLLSAVSTVLLIVEVRRQFRKKPVPSITVSNEPPNVFSHGFVLPVVDDPRWICKGEFHSEVFRLGAFRVERRFLSNDRKVLPLGRWSKWCSWVVFMGDELLPLRTSELERYGDALVRQHKLQQREELASRVSDEVTKDVPTEEGLEGLNADIDRLLKK